jgi:hypothetical protein
MSSEASGNKLPNPPKRDRKYHPNAPPGPKGNKFAVKHGLYSYRAMLNGDGLDERTSLFKALREKEQELVKALGGDPITAGASHHQGFGKEHAQHCEPG